MADCFSNYLRDKIADHVHGGPDYVRPATTYWALLTTATDAAGAGGVEVSGGSYARVALTNSATNWPASSAQIKSNGVAINWGTATANWGTVVMVAEYDASSGGNLLTFQPLTAPATINNGQAFQISAANGVFGWAA